MKEKGEWKVNVLENYKSLKDENTVHTQEKIASALFRNLTLRDVFRLVKELICVLSMCNLCAFLFPIYWVNILQTGKM